MKRTRRPKAPARKAPRARPALSSDLLRAVLEHSADMISLVDRDGTILYSSARPGRSLDYDGDEPIGRNAFDMIHPDDVPHVRQLLASLLERPGVAVTADVRARRKDGAFRTLELVALNRLDDPQTGAIVVTYRDVSDRRRLETLLQAIVDASPECLKLVSADGALIHMNSAGLAMIDADSLDQIQGKPILKLVAPEHQDAFQEFFEKVFRGESPRLRFEVIGLKGRRCWLETYGVVVADPDRKSVV